MDKIYGGNLRIARYNLNEKRSIRMQSENRVFDDAIKGMGKILKSLCKIKKFLNKRRDQFDYSGEKMKEH